MEKKHGLQRFWRLFLVLLVTVVGCFAVCGSPLQNPNTVYEKFQCIDDKTNRAMYVGEVFQRRGQCIRVQCLGNLQIWEDSCKAPKLRGNCSVIPPANEFLDYPKCCPQYSCTSLLIKDSGNTEETHIYDHYGNRKSTYITQFFTRLPASDPIKTKFNL